jgi:hypothetical protein
MIATILSLPTVLSYLLMHIFISHTSVPAGRGCCFTSDSLYPIIRPVTNRWLAPIVSSRWCHCDDVACCLNPLLDQGHESRVLWEHLLN